MKLGDRVRLTGTSQEGTIIKVEGKNYNGDLPIEIKWDNEYTWLPSCPYVHELELCETSNVQPVQVKDVNGTPYNVYTSKTVEEHEEAPEVEKKNSNWENLEVIREKDTEFYEVISSLVDYLASTYGDKYEADSGAIKSKNILLSKEGKAANIFTTIKYIQRYNTSGYKKSNNIEDVNKAIHYLLFELQRRRTHE